jgi:hypothetical protein
MALLRSLKNRYFRAKSAKSLEKAQILALKVTIFQKCGPRADLCWPFMVALNYAKFLSKRQKTNIFLIKKIIQKIKCLAHSANFKSANLLLFVLF